MQIREGKAPPFTSCSMNIFDIHGLMVLVEEQVGQLLSIDGEVFASKFTCPMIVCYAKALLPKLGSLFRITNQILDL